MEYSEVLFRSTCEAVIIKNQVKNEMKQKYTTNIIQIKEILRNKVPFNVGRLIASMFSR